MRSRSFPNDALIWAVVVAVVVPLVAFTDVNRLELTLVGVAIVLPVILLLRKRPRRGRVR